MFYLWYEEAGKVGYLPLYESLQTAIDFAVSLRKRGCVVTVRNAVTGEVAYG